MLMVHEGGADPSQACDYLMRRGLLVPQLADHVLRFTSVSC
jgi:hypothetical protein